MGRVTFTLIVCTQRGSLPPHHGSKVSSIVSNFLFPLLATVCCFFSLSQPGPNYTGSRGLQNWTLLWVTSMRRCPLTLSATAGEPAGDLWSREEMRKVKAHALDIMCPREIWILLLYCQQRCPDLIKCLVTFLRFNSHRWWMIDAQQLSLLWPSQNKSFQSRKGIGKVMPAALNFALRMWVTELLLRMTDVTMCQRKLYSVADWEVPHVSKLNKSHLAIVLWTTDPTHASYESHGRVWREDNRQ